MRADLKQIETLFAIQKVELEMVQMQKKLEELPQRQQIVAIRKKREAVEEKAQQVQAMKSEVVKTLRNLADDDERKKLKEQEAQEVIETTKGDFRLIEERSKELQQLANKRKEIKEKTEEAQLKLMKAEDLEKQVTDALDQLLVAEEKLIASFKADGTKLQQAIAKGKSTSAALRDFLPAELASAFAKASQHGAGVGVAKLQDNRCGACKTPMDAAKLREVKQDAPLGTCPNCRRLLYISE